MRISFKYNRVIIINSYYIFCENLEEFKIFEYKCIIKRWKCYLNLIIKYCIYYKMDILQYINMYKYYVLFKREKYIYKYIVM